MSVILSMNNDVPVSVNTPLKTRKDIWTNFPVNLIPLGSGEDGAERHAIAWNYKRINELWDEQPLLQRLMDALGTSTKWVVETTTRKDCVCVIRMVFDGYVPSNPPADNPTLTSLTDIYKFFPAVAYSLGNDIYSIELHDKRIATMSEIKGYDVTSEVTSLLIQALKDSTHWRVLAAKLPCEVCRIEML